MSQNATHMNDEEFVDYCYRTILLRKGDQEGKQSYLSFIKAGGSREEIIISFLESDEYKRRMLSQEFVEPGHFCSVVPSHEERSRYIKDQKPDFNMAGIDLNEEKQINLLNEFVRYYKEMPFPAEKSDTFRYYLHNPAYSYGDGITLYCMLRHFESKRVIEIGSGYSSCLMMDVNDRFFQGKIDLTFVEPYPDIFFSLIEKADKKRFTIKSQKLQEIDQSIFSRLEKNDILFIDSSHVSKLGSDVNELFFHILPALKKGVLIHIHDIFWPFELPPDWIREGRAWNEAYLLRAFLQFNTRFEILFFSTYLLWKQPQWFRENMPLFQKNPGGNIWLRTR
jgi:predicted O-methyltransferase YrrM